MLRLLITTFLGIQVSSAYAQLSVRNLTWRDTKLRARFVLQPEDDTVQVGIEGFRDLRRPEWFKLYFPVCMTLTETILVDKIEYKAMWDYKLRKPITAEPVGTYSDGRPIETFLAAINNSSPEVREKLKATRRQCDLFSTLTMEPRGKPLKGWASYSAETYLKAGIFSTVRSDAYYPFDEKEFWTGVGSPESTDAVITIENSSSYQMSEPKAYLSDPWNPHKDLGEIPKLQFSRSNFRVRTNLEPHAFITLKTKVRRTNHLIQLLPFFLVAVAFFHGRRIDSQNLVKNIYIAFFASILALITLAPNHPLCYTLYDAIILSGYFAGIAWTSCSTHKKIVWRWPIIAAVVAATFIVWWKVTFS